MFGFLTGWFTTWGLAAAGAAGVSIPVAIHLLTRLRRRRQPWAAMRFLQEALRRQKRRMQLEQLLLLAVRCLLVLLLGLALAQPLWSAAGWLGRDPGGRLVHLVIDDGLTSQSVDAADTSRLERLRERALQVLGSLDAGDRVALWRASAPVEMVLAPVESTVQQSRAFLDEAVASLRPRWTGGDLAASLAAVAAATPGMALPGESVTVVVLSDLSGAAADLDQPLSPIVKQFLSSVDLIMTRALAPGPSVQVAGMTPRRWVHVLDPRQPGSIPVQLAVRRFGDDSEGGLVSLRVVARSADDRVIAEATKTHRWSRGQLSASMSVVLPLEADVAPGLMTLEASADATARGDVLVEDNRRWSLVELRSRLLVGIVDDDDGTASSAGNWTPHTWLSAALAPTDRLVETVTIRPGDVGAEKVRGLDGCFVLRPDLLNEAGAKALDEMAQRGGLVWWIMPNLSLPAVWAPVLLERLGLPWRMEVRLHDEPWPVVSGTPAPDALALLAADWSDLLKPVAVERWFRLTSPSGAAGESATGLESWIRLADKEQAPLLVTLERGRGRMMWLTTALDADWTNLPAKPLLVPLLHETLRTTMSGASVARWNSDGRCGQSMALGPWWRGVTTVSDPRGAIRPLRSDAEGAVLAAPLRPGLYRRQAEAGATGTSGDLVLAVNIDPDAGNTTALDADRLAAWLGTDRLRWLDDQAPLAAVTRSQRRDISWPLLWAALTLAVLETALARWLSHARTGAPSLAQRLGKSMRRLLHGAEVRA